MPGPGDVVTISKNIVLDVSVKVGGVRVTAPGSLVFDKSRSITMESAGNVVIEGRLSMTPVDAGVVHRLRFVGIDERRFAGGGMEVVPTDVGLWVMGRGVLDLQGTPKLAWTRAAGDVARGAGSLRLNQTPAGWRSGDRIVIAPTLDATSSDFARAFDEAQVSGISGRTVSLSRATAYAHPRVSLGSSALTAEVLNLTRNVVVEGTPNRRAHVFIHAAARQTIRNVTIQHVGPQQAAGGKEQLVLGRYGLHFHHAENGTKGTRVEGVVVTDCGSHAFVPHTSHGITFQNCIAYRTVEDAFWWDLNEPTDDLVLDRCVAADVSNVGYPANPAVAGFLLGLGNRDRIKDCVATGVRTGDGNDGAGIHWAKKESGAWAVSGCVAHNNSHNGIRAWTNSNLRQVISGFTAYANGEQDVNHGAYINAFSYAGGVLASAISLQQHAVGGKAGLPLEFKGLSLLGDVRLKLHIIAQDPNIPTRYVECALARGVIVEENVGTQGEPPKPGFYDFIKCTRDGRDLEPADFEVRNMTPQSRIRVFRRDGSSFEITG
jgi:hypothetical protein